MHVTGSAWREPRNSGAYIRMCWDSRCSCRACGSTSVRERVTTLGVLASSEERIRSEVEQRERSEQLLAEEVRLRIEAEAKLAAALAEIERLRGGG
jgi:hypothetical protein